MRGKKLHIAALWGATSRICSKQHAAFLCRFHLTFSSRVEVVQLYHSTNMVINFSVCVCVYIYIERERAHVYIYMERDYIYIYIERERERWRDFIRVYIYI